MRALTLLAIPSLLAGCILPAATDPPESTPQASADPSASTEDAAIAVAHDALDVDYLLPGAAIEHDGTVHLWTLAFGGSAEEPTILHLAADDVGGWEDATPVEMDDEALGVDEVGLVPSSVLVEADGSWTMYGGGRLPDERRLIWRATAPAPDGPWELHPEPVLEPSTTGWDDAIVDHPSVVATGGGYLMTYGGESHAARNRGRIGAAVSTDGIAWERVPVTVPGADDALAIGPSACGIDARTMFEPELVPIDAGYRLHFGAMLDGTDVMVIGQLASDDGTTWRCAVYGPLLEPDAVVEGASLHSYLAIRGDRRGELLVEVLGPDTPSSDLWLVRPDR